MNAGAVRRVRVIDSHTGGEPTRVVLDGGPDLAGATVAEKAADLRTRHDAFRSAVANEPRGSDVLVGALLVEPSTPGCAAGVIFFNNVGLLGMCGHGTIGVVATLAHLGRLGEGESECRLETPVGVVAARRHGDGSVSVANVPAYRLAKGVRVEVEGHGPVTGDVAWGGNWFFLCGDHGQTLEPGRVGELTAFASAVRRGLERAGVTGAAGAVIDHVELVTPSPTPGASARCFVLCPGGAWDRSPCGTGTSAKLACLAADGKLAPGEVWRQESVLGSVFEGAYTPGPDGAVLPTVRGSAHVCAEATLLLDPSDPFCWGIPATVGEGGG